MREHWLEDVTRDPVRDDGDETLSKTKACEPWEVGSDALQERDLGALYPAVHCQMLDGCEVPWTWKPDLAASVAVLAERAHGKAAEGGECSAEE